MNKKMMLLLVLVPSYAFAGLFRSPELCGVIAEKVESGMSQAEIETYINGNDKIDKSMMTDLPKLVLATRMGRTFRGQKQFGLNACRSELNFQLVNGRRNRNGEDSSSASGTGGASAGATASGLAAGLEAGLGLQKETANISEANPAFANGTTDQNITHESRGTLSGQCDVLADTETMCPFPAPGSLAFITPVIEYVAENASEKRPQDDGQHCSCIEGKVNNAYTDAQARNTKLTTEKSNLEKLVIAQFGKKFINNYAAHLEDVRYFSVNAKNAFGSSTKVQTEELAKVQCSDPAEFRAAIQTRCGTTLSQADLESRMDGIFSLLNEKNKGLNYIDRLTARVMINVEPGTNKPFYRHDFDFTRNGLVKRDKNIQFADGLIAEILKDDSAVKMIQESVKLDGKLPYDGLMDYLSLELQTNNSKFSRRFLNKDLLGKAKFNELSAMFQNSANAMVALSKAIDYAMEVHPGLDNLLKKNDLFVEAASKIKRKNNSAIEFLENDETLMKPRFVKSCNQLKEDLAQVVCTNEKELLKSVGKNELRHLIKETERKDDLLLVDQVICQNGNLNPENGAFTELSLEPSDRKADVLERMAVDDITKHKNLYSKLMLENLKPTDAQTRRFFADVAREGYINRSGVIGDTFMSRFDSKSGNKISFLSQEAMDQIDNRTIDEKSVAAMANTAANTNPNNINNTQAEVVPQMAPSFASNYAAPVAAPQETGKTNTSNTDMRSDLREFLSNREDKESVDRLMRNTDDAQLAELAKLREETQRNREQLLQLQNENEKLKLRQMQDQIAELEEKRANAVSTNVAPTQTSEEVSDQRSSGRGTRDIASVSSGETAGTSAGNFSASSAGNKGGVANGGGSSAGSERAGGLNSLRNELAASGIAGLDSGSNEPVVISAGMARTGALEVRSSELSNEVLSFLETEPDVQTLIKMRNSGMIYKYKVVENGAEVLKEIAIDYRTLNADVKKIIDQKIADSGRAGSEAQRLSTEIRNLRRTYSYNALKMIIGQPVRK